MGIAVFFMRVVSKCIVFLIFIIGLFETLNEVKIDNLKRINICLSFMLCSILIEVFSNIINYNLDILYIFPLLLIYFKILKCENKYAITNSIFIFIITGISQIISYLFAKLYNHLPFSKYTSSANLFYKYTILLFIISISLIFLSLKLIQKYKENIKQIFDNIDSKDVLTSSVLALCIFLPIILHFYNKMNYKICSIIGIVTSCILYYKYEYCVISNKTKLQQTEKNTKRLYKIIDGLRLIKHDYNNILQTLNGYVITKQYDGLEQHIKKLTCESNQISTTESVNPSIFNQPAVYGIVDSKYFDALDKNIKVNINVNTNIKEINFDFADLSRVLGILLDNAIEATQQSESKEMSINFSYNKKKQADMIEIKNTIKPNLDIDVNKIFDKGESSKNEKSGLGLWEVKKIISSKNNSQIYTNIDDNTFSQTIIIEKS